MYHIKMSLLGPSWSWSYDSCIYNYICNRCISPPKLWVRIPLRRGALDATLWVKVCQWLSTGRWFSSGTPVSSTNETDKSQYNWNIVEGGVQHPKPKPPQGTPIISTNETDSHDITEILFKVVLIAITPNPIAVLVSYCPFYMFCLQTCSYASLTSAVSGTCIFQIKDYALSGPIVVSCDCRLLDQQFQMNFFTWYFIKDWSQFFFRFMKK